MKDFEGSIGDLPQFANFQLRDADISASGRGAVLRRAFCQAALVAADAATYFAAFGLLTLFGALDPLAPTVLRVLVLAALATMGLYAAFSLYPGYRLHHHEHLRRRILATGLILAGACLSALVLLAQTQVAIQIALFLSVAVLTQPWMRALSRRLLRRAGFWGEEVEVLDRPFLADYFKKNWEYGINPVPPGGSPDGDPGTRNAINGKDQARRARSALVTADILSDRDRLAALLQGYDEVIVLADLPDMKVSALQPANLNGWIGLHHRRPGDSRSGVALRRGLDLLIAVPAAVVFAPVILLAAVAIRFTDPGPVFFRQAREGRGGTTIRVLKLRTMYRDAEQRLKDLLARDPKARLEWQTHFKLKDDPRILPVIGNFLRSSSCDELPQLFNVIAGDMSIVGPRPFPVYHLEAMNGSFRKKRCTVTPGITGLWQVSERSNADIALQQQLDEFYIENRSIWLDAYIVLKTFSAVVSKNGAR